MLSATLEETMVELRTLGLVDSAEQQLKKWRTEEVYAVFWSDIDRFITEKNISELNDAFYKVIPFGTGGRRGKMGPGTNRINIRTIAESAHGFAKYMKKYFGEEEAKRRGMVITYDVRHNSLSSNARLPPTHGSLLQANHRQPIYWVVRQNAPTNHPVHLATDLP